MSAVVFDRLYETSPDPWQADTRWYEERKRALILAALGRRHYRRGYEAGCGNGHLSMALLARCDSLVASDVSANAIALAARRTESMEGIELLRLTLPRQWPPGRFDLIVLSEVLYFLTPADIAETAATARSRLAAHGEVVACNWRAPIDGYGHSGEEVHRQFEDALGLPRRFEYVDDDFLLSGWTTAPSVASSDRHP